MSPSTDLFEDLSLNFLQVNLVMKPLQKYLHSGIRRVHIDIDDTPAPDLAETKAALAKLQEVLAESQTLAHMQDIIAESQTVLTAKDTAFEDVVRQLDDCQAQLDIEKQKQKRQWEGLTDDDTDVSNLLYRESVKVDDLQAKLKIEKEVTERQRLELEMLRAQRVRVESASLIPIAPPKSPVLTAYDLPTMLTTPKRPRPTTAERHHAPAKRGRADHAVKFSPAMRTLQNSSGQKK